MTNKKANLDGSGQNCFRVATAAIRVHTRFERRQGLRRALSEWDHSPVLRATEAAAVNVLRAHDPESRDDATVAVGRELFKGGLAQTSVQLLAHLPGGEKTSLPDDDAAPAVWAVSGALRLWHDGLAAVWASGSIWHRDVLQIYGLVVEEE